MINYIQRKRNKKGFTLVELVVVVAILGILAALAIPRFTRTRETANTNTVIANLRTIKSAVELYAAQYNDDPEKVNLSKAQSVLGEENWPKGPGGAEYIIDKGQAQVYLAGLSVDPDKFKKASSYSIYYIAK